MELSCLAYAMVVGSEQEYLAVLLTLQTKRNDATGKMTNELTDHAKKWFRFARYDVQTVNDVLTHLDHGLQHVIQAGIDRVNQGVRMTAHMIADWRIMPQFTYEVRIVIRFHEKYQKNLLKSNSISISQKIPKKQLVKSKSNSISRKKFFF